MIDHNMEQFVSTFSASGQPPKETCRQCRFRKVRCDGKHGEKGCGDCERLKFDCSFVAGPTTPATTHAATTAESTSSLPSPTVEAGRVVERRRTSKACTHCRQQKVRCSGGATCLACKKKGLTCVYGTDRRRSSRVASSSVAGTPTETAFPSHAALEEISGADDTSATSPTSAGTTSSEPGTVTVRPPRAGPLLLPPDIQALVEFYFNHVYPLPSYAFMHPQTTIRQCSEGSLETCLAYAISAVARHHRGSSSHGHGDVELSWIQAAEDLIWKHLESPTIARLQALLLIVLYRLETGAFQRAFMLSSLAARGAAAMRLNYERTTPQDAAGRASRETRRRLMWSLKLVERYFSMGLPEFELCPVENVYLELPCWEEDFSSTPGDGRPRRTLQSSDFGAYHLCVKLEMLRRDMVKLTRSISICDSPFPELPTVMHDFEQHLDRLGRELPNGPTLTADRISQLLNTPWLARQVLVHLSFHQCHCDLYRLLLRDYREAAPAVVLDALDPSLLARAEQLCLQHATAVVDILATLNQQSQRAQLLEFDTAICGYHAARILLFAAQFGRSSLSSSPSPSPSSPAAPPARPSEEWALSRAELCLASLRRFFPASRLAKPVLEEMRRAIAVFSTRSATMTPSRLASPGPAAAAAGGGGGGGGGGARDPTAGLSAAARVRQRLAIHSLLRQADFTDDDDGRDADRRDHLGGDAGTHQQHVAPHGIFTPSSPPGVASGTASCARDASGPSSGRSVSSPQTPGPCDGDLWQLGWFDGGDAAERWAGPPTKIHPALPPHGPGLAAGGPGGGPTSFSFPWLQREEAAVAAAVAASSSSSRGEMT